MYKSFSRRVNCYIWGEANLGECWGVCGGSAKEGEGWGVGVSRISTSDSCVLDGEAEGV